VAAVRPRKPGERIDDPVWVPTVFTKNRDRLLTTEMSLKVMAAILAHREVAPLCRMITSRSTAR
jgi:hypothetical protein